MRSVVSRFPLGRGFLIFFDFTLHSLAVIPLSEINNWVMTPLFVELNLKESERLNLCEL